MSNRTVVVSASGPEENPYDLPSRYQFQRILGWGGFGVVLKCLKKDTQETVAIKVPIYSDVKEEATLMKRFMTYNCHKCNIVKFLDSFNTRFGKALVFEELDISLMEFFAQNRRRPLLLSDVRSIIRQSARALEAMKRMGMIHTDIKPDNIMLVDESKRPLEVKMIDFGLAIPARKAKQGMKVQTAEFRAPEVILGLPFTEAIDMWSLGCVMAIIVAGGLLFSGDNDYELLQDIVHLLGQPPDRRLNKGMHTKNYFIQTKTKGWRFKTSQEYLGRHAGSRRFGLSSLDDLKKARYETLNRTEDLEREQCIELLKAMLTLDAAQRITPSQVLSHPFILWTRREDSDTTEDAPQLEEQQKECAHSVLPQVGETSTHVSRTSKDLDCMSPAAAPEAAAAAPEAAAAAPEDDNIQPNNHSPPPHVIHIRPAPPENTVQTDRFLPEVISISKIACRASSSEHCDCEPPEDKDTTNIQPDNHSPPPLVIHIRPAPPENTVQTDRFLPEVISISRIACRASSSEHCDCEPPEDKDTTNIQPNDHSPPPLVIYVQPVAAENLECDSLQPGLTQTLESFVTDKDTSMTEDSTTCGEKQQQSPKKKKRKNCFQRFYSWIKKNFCSCMTCVDEE